MKWKQVEENPRTFALVFDAGDEISAGLTSFAKENNLSDASFKAIGALESVKLGWYNPETKKYAASVELHEQLELLSLIGDVAQQDGKPIVHAHLVVGRSDGSTAGGHLLNAAVRPTCELFLTESPAHLSKALDPESGLVLIKL